jgi:high affinity sulfate transporter 1
MAGGDNLSMENRPNQRAQFELSSIIPGMKMLRTYDRSLLRTDAMAGLSVAAVTLPVALAYAQLAELPPVYGLYASILPPVAYALFGSSKQLIVGPDSATAALVAATLVPLSVGSPTLYVALSAGLAIITGILCIVGGIARLGFVADFLSKPILAGYLSGVAIAIIVGQLGKVFGFPLAAQGFFRLMGEFLSKLDQTHFPTLAVGLSSLVLLLVFRRWPLIVPGPLIVVASAIALGKIIRFDELGVAVVGQIPAGFPSLGVPQVPLSNIGPLILGAFGLLIISFSDLILPARSFAAKSSCEIDANQELIALGAANIAAGLSQSFAVSGSASRTAVNDSTGGKTQMVQIVAAAVIALALLFFTGPLAYLPIAVLGAVLIVAVLGLFQFQTIKWLYSVSKPEFGLAVITTLGVITVGILPGILIAIGLAIIQLLGKASRPHDALLGEIPGKEGFFDIERYPEAQPIPGLVILRIDSAVLFFNADYLRARGQKIAAEMKPEWIILDAESIPMIDTTAVDSFEKTITGLRQQGIPLVVARANDEVRDMMDRTGLAEKISEEYFFRNVRTAVDAFRRRGKTD